MKKFYFILTLICLFSCSLLISFNVFAQDGAPDGSHGSVSYNQKDKTMNFFMEAGQEAGQLFYGLGEDVVNGVDNAYAVWLYQFKPESELSMGEKQLIQHFCDIDEGNESASVIFDIDDSFNFTLKDEYQEDWDSLMDSVITAINNRYLYYQCYQLEDCNKFLQGSGKDFNQFKDEILNTYTSSDYPIYINRNYDYYYSSALGSGKNIDGLVFTSGLWNGVVNYWDTYQLSGYLNKVDGVADFNYFGAYSNGNYVTLAGTNMNVSWYSVDSYLPVQNWNPTPVRNSFIIGNENNNHMLFFRDISCYLDFYNNKSSIPMNFVDLDIPENFDYSDFFKNIDDDIVKNTHNIEELYNYISSELKASIDRINDSLKDTNSILKEIRNLIGDKWDRSLGKNVLDYLPDIVDKLEDIYWDVHALNPDNVQQLTETILNDPSLENRLKHIFPFGVFQDFKDLSELLAKVERQELVFTFTTDFFYWGFDSEPTTIEINISSLPAFNILQSMINFFVICLFNYSMARIEYKFISMFFGG